MITKTKIQEKIEDEANNLVSDEFYSTESELSTNTLIEHIMKTKFKYYYWFKASSVDKMLKYAINQALQEGIKLGRDEMMEEVEKKIDEWYIEVQKQSNTIDFGIIGYKDIKELKQSLKGDEK